MITVKFLGGAKKSFSTDKLEIDQSDISIKELLEILLSIKPENTLNLDIENILIAINGVDSSAMKGKMTIIKNNDVISIIPVIHGGTSKRIIFTISKKTIQLMEIKGHKNINVNFLDALRTNFPKLKIQAISSNFILNLSHAKKIFYLSLTSQKNNALLSNKLEIDILMRFALTSQISDAINTVGIQSNKNFILVAIGEKKQLDALHFELSLHSLDVFSKDNYSFLKKQFKISKKQLNSILSKSPLEDLLVEKATLLL
ncbi:MAG: KEOPS complex subunit Cgi121 [Nitrosopumilus sp.]|nr:KEOPS complex subunit Cgi121 [Nitrosopumilus sp.]